MPGHCHGGGITIVGIVKTKFIKYISSESLKAGEVYIFQHFSSYEQLGFQSRMI